MNSIDRVAGQEAARTYVQQSDAARTAGLSAGATQPTGKAQPALAPKADSVTLSADARSLASARAEVEKAPAVREQKVADIKQQVDRGTYTVSARVLARKMIDASKNPA